MTKFKNYVNFITDDNKIFSKEDINHMSSVEIKNNNAANYLQKNKELTNFNIVIPITMPKY